MKCFRQRERAEQRRALFAEILAACGTINTAGKVNVRFDREPPAELLQRMREAGFVVEAWGRKGDG